MAQTVTQILLSQQAFTKTPPPVSGIGYIIPPNTLVMTADSPPLPLGVIIRGVNIPANTTVGSYGPTVVDGVAYTLSTVVSVAVPPTTITTVLGAVDSYAVVGDKVPAASYYLGNKALQTVNIKVTGFTGKIIIEASLATTPSVGLAEPSDWFTVHTVTANAQGVAGTVEALASNTNTSVNINGNFVWMRARLENFAEGVVNWIKLSY